MALSVSPPVAKTAKRYGSRIPAGQPITACQISGGRNTHRESMKSD